MPVRFSPPPPPAGPVTADQVSVILPTFNEAGNIVPLMEGILAALGPQVEIIVVDDASPDGTAGLVRDFAAGHPGVRLVLRENERGLTSAIARGVAESQREAVVWMDCDLAMPPADIPRLLAALKDRHLAMGSRYLAGGRGEGNPPLARFLSRTICLLSHWLLPGGFTDYTSGFMAARRAVVAGLGLRGDYGEYCLDLICRAHLAGCRLKEVPYVFGHRHAGESKTATNLWGFFRRGRKYLGTLGRLFRERLGRG